MMDRFWKGREGKGYHSMGAILCDEIPPQTEWHHSFPNDGVISCAENGDWRENVNLFQLMLYPALKMRKSFPLVLLITHNRSVALMAAWAVFSVENCLYKQ